MKALRYILLFLFLLGLKSSSITAQALPDSIDRFKVSISVLSFAGRYPSLQGGVHYKLTEKSAVDAEASWLLPKRTGDADINNNIGFQVKAGYMLSVLNPNNFWVLRMFCRNTNAFGREEFSRFQGAYVERIDFHSTKTLTGLTLGWMRHTHHDMCDFQIGLSAGYGRLFTSGNLPQDAELLRQNRFFWSEDIEQTEGYQPIAYLDFKILF